MKPNFSVVVIAKNEASTLPRLHASLKEFLGRGGEMILVDTGSTDTTVSIARDLGIRVEEVGPRFTHTITPQTAYDINERFVVPGEEKIVEGGDTIFDYAAARNYAASLATNDMVAMPDCDEIYTKMDLGRIVQEIASGVEQLEYNFVFAHDDAGREIVKFLHCKFYDRRKLKWVGIVHEVLQNTGAPVHRKLFGEDVIKLEHWQNTDTNRGGYLKGLALSVVNESENDRNAHYFGRELFYKGRPRSAIKQLEAHVAMGKWPEERSQSLVHIGEAHMQLGDAQKAIHSWIDAFDTCPKRREAFMKIAEYYYHNKSADHVIAYASAVLPIPQSGFYATFQPFYEHVPHEFLYWAYWHQGQKEIAKIHYNMCVRYQPFNSQYLHDYALFYELPKVSIIIPTLREDGLKRVRASIDALNYPKDKIEVIVLVDEPRIGVPKRVKEAADKATGEWIVYAADDMEFEPDCIAAALAANRQLGDDFEKGLIAFNGGPVSPDEGNICEHFMIHRVLFEILPKGEIFDTDFHHVGVDNLLWARMKKAGEAFRCEQAKFIHHHFTRTGVMDDVNRMGWESENVKHDRELLAKKLAEL